MHEAQENTDEETRILVIVDRNRNDTTTTIMVHDIEGVTIEDEPNDKATIVEIVVLPADVLDQTAKVGLEVSGSMNITSTAIIAWFDVVFGHEGSDGGFGALYPVVSRGGLVRHSNSFADSVKKCGYAILFTVCGRMGPSLDSVIVKVGLVQDEAEVGKASSKRIWKQDAEKVGVAAHV